MTNKRIVERKENDQWVCIEFMDLKKGDTFRLFETPDLQIVEHKGITEWIATSDAYIRNGIGTINCDVQK